MKRIGIGRERKKEREREERCIIILCCVLCNNTYEVDESSDSQAMRILCVASNILVRHFVLSWSLKTCARSQIEKGCGRWVALMVLLSAVRCLHSKIRWLQSWIRPQGNGRVWSSFWLRILTGKSPLVISLFISGSPHSGDSTLS